MPPDRRLPDHARPVRYGPRLWIPPDRDAFRGRVAIDLEVREPANRIELHAAGLDPDAVELSHEAGTVEPRLERDPERERWTLHPPEAVEPGRARVSLAYRGRIGDRPRGLHRPDPSRADPLVLTQGEPTGARTVFPCLDEPRFRAPVAWRVRAPEAWTVLANAPRETVRDHGDGTATRRFAATRPIPTYLAALALGRLEATEPARLRDTRVRSWAPPGTPGGERARDQAVRLLAWYEDHLQHPYPYAKLDLLAAPGFAYGAMENPGLVIARGSVGRVDEGAGRDERKALDRVLAHELAHMWLGNHATFARWRDFWLKEGLAEWLAHRALADVQPDHEAALDLQAHVDAALADDALGGAAPLGGARTPAEAMAAFDPLAYGKATGLVALVAGYLGDETLREGLARHVDALDGAGAPREELWARLAGLADEPVDALVEPWIARPGHPRVDVELAEERAGRVAIRLRQTPHRARPAADPGARPRPIPLALRYADDTGDQRARLVLEDAEATVELTVDGELAWLAADPAQAGLYRVRYGPRLRERLRSRSQLGPRQRWLLLRDGLALVRAGRRTVGDHLRDLDALATGRAPAGFLARLVDQLETLRDWLHAADDARARAGLRAWVRETLGPALDELGPRPAPGDAPGQRHRRALLLEALAGLGDQARAVEAALEVAERERRDPADVDPDLAGAAARVEARRGPRGTLETHLDAYRSRRAEGRPRRQVARYRASLPLCGGEDEGTRLLELLAAEAWPAGDARRILEGLLAQPRARGPTLERLARDPGPLVGDLEPGGRARVADAVGRAGPGHADAALRALTPVLSHAAPEAVRRARERLQAARELAEAGVPQRLADWARDRA